MTKSKKSKGKRQESGVRGQEKVPRVTGAKVAMVQPVPQVPGLTVEPEPVPRERGDGPVCPACKSGMTVLHTGRDQSQRHPFESRAIRTYACKRRAKGCTETLVRFGQWERS